MKKENLLIRIRKIEEDAVKAVGTFMLVAKKRRDGSIWVSSSGLHDAIEKQAEVAEKLFVLENDIKKDLTS